MLPLTWVGCLIRLGRLENAAKDWISSSVHDVNDHIIAWRNIAAHEADIAADIALLRFIAIYPNTKKLPHFREVKDRLHQHTVLMKSQFGRDNLKTTELIKNKKVMELLTLRGTIWSKKAIYSTTRNDCLKNIDQLIEKYEQAVSGNASLNPFSEDGLLAAEFQQIMLRTNV